MDKRPDILFVDVPIIDDECFIQETFINREKEILIAQNDFRPEQPRNEIYAIHGFSRVGKSHLAVKIAEDLSRQHRMHYFYVSANLKGNAVDVLTSLYEKIRDYFHDGVTVKGKEEQEHLDFVLDYLGRINPVFLMPSAHVAFRSLERKATKLKASFKSKIPFLGFGAGLDGETSKGTDREQTVELTRPNLDGTRVLICFLLEMLTWITGRTTLLLIDDLDLLEEIKLGEEERDNLINQLKHMASLKRTAVWITSRKQYFIERQKEMINFIEVEFLKEEELIGIYQARVRAFNNDEPIFGQDVLTELTAGFRGIAGAFLYECQLFRRYHVGKAGPLTMTHLTEYLQAEMDKFLDNPETNAIFGHITKAVTEHLVEIEIEDVKKGHGLIYRVLMPKGYKQNVYEVLPLFAKAILGQTAAT